MKPVNDVMDRIISLQKRLGYSDAAFEEMMRAPQRSFEDFPTYRRTFQRMRPLFFVLAKLDLVPRTFYIKYCVPEPPAPAGGAR